jgi:hypothetical protein
MNSNWIDRTLGRWRRRLPAEPVRQSYDDIADELPSTTDAADTAPVEHWLEPVVTADDTQGRLEDETPATSHAPA